MHALWMRIVSLVMGSAMVVACAPIPSSGQPRSAASGKANAAGEALARELNTRYNEPSSPPLERCPDGRALYFCTGILYRAVAWSPEAYFWNSESQNEYYEGVSFSYLHKYVGIRSTYRPQGFVIDLAKDWKPWGPGPDDHPEMFCSFSFDGMTGGNRGLTGCGSNIVMYPRESVPCIEQHIADPVAYAKHYLFNNGGTKYDAYDRWHHNCSFGTDASSFMLSLRARVSGTLEPTSAKYSEQVLRNWPINRPDAVPIQGLYFDVDAPDRPHVLCDVQNLQKDFLDATNRFLPVLRWHGEGDVPFSYDVADQGPPGPHCPSRPPGVIPTGAGSASYHGDPGAMKPLE